MGHSWTFMFKMFTVYNVFKVVDLKNSLIPDDNENKNSLTVNR